MPPRQGQPDRSSQVPLENPGAIQAQLAAFSMNSPTADAQQTQMNQSSPQLSRMSTPPPGQGPDVWVTVPVDKVSVANGKGTVTPTYSNQVGYREGGTPPKAPTGTAIPPTPAAGRP